MSGEADWVGGWSWWERPWLVTDLVEQGVAISTHVAEQGVKS